MKINGIKFKNGVRVHQAACRGRAHHVNPHQLLDDPGIARELCAEAKQAALLTTSAVIVAIAASGLVDEAPAVAEGDRLLNVKEAAKRLSVSTAWLYRNAESLPFTKRLGPGQLRFSEAGILAYIQAKSAA